MPTPEICPVCGNVYQRRSSLQRPAGPCPRCKQREKARRIRLARIAQGLCGRCGRPVDNGRRYCRACGREANEHHRQRALAGTGFRRVRKGEVGIGPSNRIAPPMPIAPGNDKR